MAALVSGPCGIDVMQENLRDISDREFKSSQQQMLEKLPNGQDVFLIQPRGSGKFES